MKYFIYIGLCTTCLGMGYLSVMLGKIIPVAVVIVLYIMWMFLMNQLFNIVAEYYKDKKS